MDQKRFIEIILSNKDINKSDIAELIEIKNNFPYAQLPFVLLTLGTYRSKTVYFEDFLKNSALRINNRQRLKNLLENLADLPKEPSVISTESNIELLQAIDESSQNTKEQTLTDEISNLNTEELTNEIVEFNETASDLTENIDEIKTQKLETDELVSEIKYEFEIPIKELKTLIPTNSVSSTLLNNNIIDTYRFQDYPIENSEFDNYASLVYQFIESYKNTPISKTIINNQEDSIDKFLKNPYKLQKNQLIQFDNEERKDLSAQYTSNADEFYSEALANIYVKQKKYSKAIEAYKKLMLVYPQKNTYFASKISELENLL